MDAMLSSTIVGVKQITESILLTGRGDKSEGVAQADEKPKASLSVWVWRCKKAR